MAEDLRSVFQREAESVPVGRLALVAVKPGGIGPIFLDRNYGFVFKRAWNGVWEEVPALPKDTKK